MLIKQFELTESNFQVGVGDRIKFIETNGRKYIDHLKIGDPFHKKCPLEENCLLCKNSLKNANCKVAKVGYTIICKLCQTRNILKAYEGETGRIAYIRGQEHTKELLRKSEQA